MLTVSVEKVDENPEFYAVTLEDPLPTRGMRISARHIVTGDGIRAIQKAIVQSLDKKPHHVTQICVEGKL